MGGTESKTTQITSNQVIVNNENLENSIEFFRKLDSYGPKKDVNPSLLPRNEKKDLDILKKKQ